MAARKASIRRSSQSPNQALVVFLVFFILLSIGLGFWAYQNIATKKAAEDTAKKEKESKAVAEKAERYYKGQALWVKATLVSLTDAEKTELNDFLTALGTADYDKVAPEKGVLVKLIADDQKVLGWDKDKGLKSTYKKQYEEKASELKTKSNELKKAKEDLTTQMAENKRINDSYERIHKDFDSKLADKETEIEKLSKKIKDAEAKVSADISATFEKLSKANEDLNKENEKKNEQIAALQKQLDKIKNKAGGGVEVVKGEEGKRGEGESLVLNIAEGRPLWDLPRGKIVQVDPTGKKPTINLGSAQGVKPQMTFNIYSGKSSAGPTSKAFKGTLEIISVIDANTSQARLTGVWDPKGGLDESGALVSPANVAGKAIAEGDLLYNLVWGEHVAIAGHLDFLGDPTDLPAQQAQQLKTFRNFLEKRGIIVDAYVDPATGEIQGGLTSRTSYLILGTKMTGEKGEEKEAKSGIAKKVNDSINELRKKAVERGTFVISPHNFAMVMGYRMLEIDPLAYRPPLTEEPATEGNSKKIGY
jgi:hypothetical protein